MALHAGLAHRLALFDITRAWAKAELIIGVRAAHAQNAPNASSRARATHVTLTLPDFARVVADVVVLRSIHYRFHTGRRAHVFKRSLSRYMRVARGFVRTS